MESKVQRMSRKVVVVQDKIGRCGHKVIRVIIAPQSGGKRKAWWCETCALFNESGQVSGNA